MQSNIDSQTQRTATPPQEASTTLTTDEFRSHWNDNFAQSGGSFEDYSPAYLYGTGLASNGRLAGRAWADIEPDVHNDWETLYPESAWDRVKAAVRYGWERAVR